MREYIKVYAQKFLQYIKNNNIDFDKEIKNQLIELISVFYDNSERSILISRYLKSDNVEFNKKIDLIKEICENEYFIRFLYIIHKMKHFSFIEKIFEEIIIYHDMIVNSVFYGNIYSVISLNQEEIDKIQKIFFEKTGHSVVLKNKIKKDIIGGFIVEYEDKILDLSLKTLLNKIERKLFC